MTKRIKTFLNWSSGKDAALALHYLQQGNIYEVQHLLTSVNRHFNRVSMHGVRTSLLKQQINSLNLPYSIIELPEEPSMEEYESIMAVELKKLQEQKFKCSAFGDIFLEDLRSYREDKLNEMNMQACFPLWNKDTRALLQEFIDFGFKAIVVCIKSDLLDQSFAGRIIDKAFLNDLPKDVDPCGENGEFHTFCFDGPIFKKPVNFSLGEKTFKEYQAPKTNTNEQSQSMGFWFCDLIPEGEELED